MDEMASPISNQGAKSAAKRTNDFFNLLRELKLDNYYYVLGTEVNVRSLSSVSDVKDEDLRSKVKMMDNEIKVLRERYHREYPGASKKKKSSEIGRSRSFLDRFKRNSEPIQKKRTTVWYNEGEIVPVKDSRSKSVPVNVYNPMLRLSKSPSNFRVYGRNRPNESTTSTISSIHSDVGDDDVFSLQLDRHSQVKVDLPATRGKSKNARRKKSKQKSLTTSASATEKMSQSAPGGSHDFLLKRRSVNNMIQCVSMAMKKNNSNRGADMIGRTSTQRIPCSGQIPGGIREDRLPIRVLPNSGERQMVDGSFQISPMKTSPGLADRYNAVNPSGSDRKWNEQHYLTPPPLMPRRGETQNQESAWSDLSSHEFDYEMMYVTASSDENLDLFPRRSVLSIDYECMSLTDRYENFDVNQDDSEDELRLMQHGYENMPEPEKRRSQSMPELLDVYNSSPDQQEDDCRSRITQNNESMESVSTKHIKRHPPPDKHEYENVPSDVELGEEESYDLEKHDYENVATAEEPSKKSAKLEIHSSCKHEQDEGRFRKRSGDQNHTTQEEDDGDQMEEAKHDYENVPSGHAELSEKSSPMNLDGQGTLKPGYVNLDVGTSVTLPQTKCELSHLKEHYGYMCPLDEICSDYSDGDYDDVNEPGDYDDVSEPEPLAPVVRDRKNSTSYVGPEWENKLTSNLNSCNVKGEFSRMNCTNPIQKPCNKSQGQKEDAVPDISIQRVGPIHGYENVDATVEDRHNSYIEICSVSTVQREFINSDINNEGTKPHHAYENLDSTVEGSDNSFNKQCNESHDADIGSTSHYSRPRSYYSAQSYTSEEELLQRHKYVKQMSSEDVEGEPKQNRPAYENVDDETEVSLSLNPCDKNIHIHDDSKHHSYENIPSECDSCTTEDDEPKCQPVASKKTRSRQVPSKAALETINGQPPISNGEIRARISEWQSRDLQNSGAQGGLCQQRVTSAPHVPRSKPININRLQQRRRTSFNEY
ncbi:uncharacterized protein [Ptychodera flava]